MYGYYMFKLMKKKKKRIMEPEMVANLCLWAELNTYRIVIVIFLLLFGS